MSLVALRVATLAVATGLAACASGTDAYKMDGIAKQAPVGTNIKPREGYRRGGSSSSVKVIGRNHIRQMPGGTADDIVKGK